MVVSSFPSPPTVLFKSSSHANATSAHNSIVIHARERVRHRTTKRGELPIQNPDHAVLCRVKDEVIEFIITVHDPHTARLALVRQVPLVPRYELVPPWYFAHQLARVDVFHRGLGERDFGQCFDLAWKVRLVGAEIFEAEVIWVERGERAESAHC